MKSPLSNMFPAILLIAVLAVSGARVAVGDSQWTTAQAWNWYNSIGQIRGVNYVPSTAQNTTAFWQASTFDPTTISRELGWAHADGINSVRVNLQYLVWESDPTGLIQRMNQFLSIASSDQISTTFTLFDDINFAGKEPYLGVQDQPLPGVCAGNWTPSPGPSRATSTDPAVQASLQAYVQDLVGTFGQDHRVLMWDLYNEPGNFGMGTTTLPLVENAFAWRELCPLRSH